MGSAETKKRSLRETARRVLALESAAVAALGDRIDASFEEAVAEYNDERMATQEALVELVEAMKRGVTSEEWKAIAKYQLARLNLRELAYEPAAGGK